MKTLTLNVVYTNGKLKNGKGKFWADSYIKNKEIAQENGETIHETVKRAIKEIDCADICYNGKPKLNIYTYNKDGSARIVGYIYRVRHFIADRQANFCGNAYFNAWVNIKQSISIELENIENN